MHTQNLISFIILARYNSLEQHRQESCEYQLGSLQHKYEMSKQVQIHVTIFNLGSDYVSRHMKSDIAAVNVANADPIQ
jgi:outer membrane receptor for ferrienterochelin and colicin